MTHDSVRLQRAPRLSAERRAKLLGTLALLGAVALIASEFTTLYAIHVVGSSAVIRTVTAGSHHGYALVPIGLLAALLALAVHRGAGRPVMLAMTALGLIALVIALVGDLPDANTRGLVAAGASYKLGNASPSLGFYLETLAATLLLAVGGIGALSDAGAAGDGPHADIAPRTRPGSGI